MQRLSPIVYAAAMISCAAGCLASDAPTADETQLVGGGSDPIDPPPSGLFANVDTDTQIQLGWRCGSNQASETRVMRSVGRDGPQEQIASEIKRVTTQPTPTPPLPIPGCPARSKC